MLSGLWEGHRGLPGAMPDLQCRPWAILHRGRIGRPWIQGAAMTRNTNVEIELNISSSTGKLSTPQWIEVGMRIFWHPVLAGTPASLKIGWLLMLILVIIGTRALARLVAWMAL